MSIDVLFDKTYDRNNYNCAHLCVDAWLIVTGKDIKNRLSGFLLPPDARAVNADARAGWMRIPSPESPCLVLMRRNKCSPHVGMYFDGKVVHITEAGVQYQPLDVASNGFKKIRYYKYDK